MLNVRRMQQSAPDIIQRRNTPSSQKFSSSNAPLKLPSLKGLPVHIMPALLTASLDQVSVWGKVLHRLSPEEIFWPAGIKINQITVDIVKGIERWIRETIDADLPACIEVGIVKDGILKILAWTFPDGASPIFFLETVSAVKTFSPKLSALVAEGLILLGSRDLNNWVSAKEMEIENLEWRYEDEVERIELQRMYENELLNWDPFIGEKAELRRRSSAFIRRVKRLKPRGKSQKLAAELLETISRILEAEMTYEFAPEDSDGYHIGLGLIMPILYTNGDKLSERHWEDMDDHLNGGDTVFGDQLVFLTNPQYFQGNGIIKRFNRFLEQIQIRALYGKMEKLILTLTREEVAGHEPDLRIESNHGNLQKHSG